MVALLSSRLLVAYVHARSVVAGSLGPDAWRRAGRGRDPFATVVPGHARRHPATLVSRSWRFLAAGLVAMVMVAGCGGGENTLTQEQGPPSGAGGSSPAGAGEIAGDAIDVDDPEFEAALRSFYDEYLLASDLHRTPDQEVAELGSGLAELASPSVVAEADAWRAANEAHGSGLQRVESLFSVANIVDIAVEGDRVTIEDCTAETATMITGQDIEAYVRRSAQVVHDAGRYRVVETEVAHEGQIDSPGYGCVPEAMAEQARGAVEAMVAGVGSAQADPGWGWRGRWRRWWPNPWSPSWPRPWRAGGRGLLDHLSPPGGPGGGRPRPPPARGGGGGVGLRELPRGAGASGPGLVPGGA